MSLDDLGLPADTHDGVQAQSSLLQQEALARWLLPRRRNTHKGESGHVLCIGGDDGSGGAIEAGERAEEQQMTLPYALIRRESDAAPSLATRRPQGVERR